MRKSCSYEIKQHYGADGANSIIAQISNKVFLQVEDDETEAKVLKFFGAHKRYESSLSTQHLPHGVSVGSGEAAREVPLLTSSELWDLPPPSPENGIQGFARTPWIGRYRMRAPFEIPSHDPYEVDYDRRDPADLRLADLTVTERQQLGIKPDAGRQQLPQPAVTLPLVESPQLLEQEQSRPRSTKRRAKAATLEMIENGARTVKW